MLNSTFVATVDDDTLSFAVVYTPQGADRGEVIECFPMEAQAWGFAAGFARGRNPNARCGFPDSEGTPFPHVALLDGSEVDVEPAGGAIKTGWFWEGDQ